MIMIYAHRTVAIARRQSTGSKSHDNGPLQSNNNNRNDSYTHKQTTKDIHDYFHVLALEQARMKIVADHQRISRNPNAIDTHLFIFIFL